jgi:hypothetical protein
MNGPEEQESRNFADRTTKSRKSARREGKFLSVRTSGVLTHTHIFLYRNVFTWGGGIASGFLDRTEVQGVINAVCLLIEPTHHCISLRTHQKKRKRYCVSIDKREGSSLPEYFVRRCTKELDVPHLSCFHDVLCPRLPGTSPTDRATGTRKHHLSMSIHRSAR